MAFAFRTLPARFSPPIYLAFPDLPSHLGPPPSSSPFPPSKPARRKLYFLERSCLNSTNSETPNLGLFERDWSTVRNLIFGWEQCLRVRRRGRRRRRKRSSLVILVQITPPTMVPTIIPSLLLFHFSIYMVGCFLSCCCVVNACFCFFFFFNVGEVMAKGRRR